MTADIMMELYAFAAFVMSKMLETTMEFPHPTERTWQTVELTDSIHLATGVSDGQKYQLTYWCTLFVNRF